MMGLNEDTKSIYEKRMAEINRLPPDQRQAALAMLTRDYQGRGELLGAQRGEAQGHYQDALTNMPMGAQTAGPGSNPFARAVANPMGSVAKGMQGYQAKQDRAQAEAAMEQMSQSKEQATSDLMGAQSNALRGGGRPMPGTPEYEALMRKQRMI